MRTTPVSTVDSSESERSGPDGGRRQTDELDLLSRSVDFNVFAPPLETKTDSACKVAVAGITLIRSRVEEIPARNARPGVDEKPGRFGLL